MKPKRLGQQFGLLIAVVAAGGVALAMFADRPSLGTASGGYWDALREIGGAVVAGAILAGLVVWFEDRREDQRVDRENSRDQARFDKEQRREEEAARKAWQREIDIKIVATTFVDLADARRYHLDIYGEEATERPAGHLPFLHSTRDGRTFRESFSEVDSLMRFRRDDHLSSAWSDWSAADDVLADVPPPSPVSNKQTRKSQFHGLDGLPGRPTPPERDPEAHATAQAMEERAWRQLLAALEAHIDANYPA